MNLKIIVFILRISTYGGVPFVVVQSFGSRNTANMGQHRSQHDQVCGPKFFARRDLLSAKNSKKQECYDNCGEQSQVKWAFHVECDGQGMDLYCTYTSDFCPSLLKLSI